VIHKGLHLLSLLTLGWFISGLRPLHAANADAVTIPDGYSKDYLFLQITQDVPLAASQDDLRASGKFNLGLDYRHLLGTHWMVGVHYRIRSFERKNSQSLSILSLSNQTQRIMRLYHPFYALIGTEWSYMIPTRSLSLPLTKDPEYQTEIGVGLNASLWYYINSRLLLELRGARWRGTKTNRLHGWESTLSAGYAF
jgi:hypothetical protein